MKHFPMVALRPFTHDGKTYAIGDRFTATRTEADVFRFRGLARFAQQTLPPTRLQKRPR